MTLNIGIVQFCPLKDRNENFNKVKQMSLELVSKGAELIILPEMFVQDFVLSELKVTGELIPGPTTNFLSNLAKDLNVFIIGGSNPHELDGKLYNTCQVINSSGELIGYYSKQRLYRVSIPGKITVSEGDVFTPGNKRFSFNIKGFKIGIAICFDIRFPEIALEYSAIDKCDVIVYPSAFHTSTGPYHWKPLGIARALDSQCYIVCVSASNDERSRFSTYGHSFISDPMGKCVSEIDEKENILLYTIEKQMIESTRNSIPVHYIQSERLN